MITLFVVGVLLVTVGLGGNSARADDGCCACSCGGGGLFSHAKSAPSFTYYAPYPYWFPQYFNVPPYTDYQVVQYVTPPAETAAIVKERILAINAGNPALPLPPKESLPYPKEKTKKPGS